MSVLILTILATLFYAGFQIFSRLAGGKIDGFLVPIFTNGASVIIALMFFSWYKSREAGLILTTRPGVLYAVLAGVSIAGFAISFAKIFQKQGNLAVVSPIIFGGSILLATLFGVILLKEHMNIMHLVGFVAILFGIGLIVFAKTHQ